MDDKKHTWQNIFMVLYAGMPHFFMGAAVVRGEWLELLAMWLLLTFMYSRIGE